MSRFGSYLIIGLALLLAGSAPALADSSGVEWLRRMQAEQPPQADNPDGVWVSVKVQNVDWVGHLLTVSHDAAAQIGMPPMTMTFPVEESTHPHLVMLHKGEVIQILAVNRDGIVKIAGFRMNH